MSGICSAHQHKEPGCKACEVELTCSTSGYSIEDDGVKGNMGRVRAACTCGWRGLWRYNHDDASYTNSRREHDNHLKKNEERTKQ